MYVNTIGGGKTQQQQQPLQNQANVSVRHNNPYQQHTQQHQPHFDHHQGQVAFVTYPFCNLGPATHGNTGGNNVGVGGGQVGHLLYQTPHQPQSQPLPTQQQVGLHNNEQALHYFAKGTQLQAHPLHHAPPQHSQIRNMIATVSHQRQPYMVSPNYILSHAILQQQTRPPILANTAQQHVVAAASGGTMAKQLQNTAARSIAPSGPTSYVTPPFCTPPLMLGTSPTAVTQQTGPILTTAARIRQPPPIQAYAHMSGGLLTNPTPSTSINMQTAGVAVGTTPNTEHNSNTNTNTIKKPRQFAIPIVHPDTLEIVPLEHLIDAEPPQTAQIKSEANVELVSIQTDNDNSVLDSIVSEPSDTMPPTHSLSVAAVIPIQNVNVDFNVHKEDDCEIQEQGSGVEVATTTLPSVTDPNSTSVSLHSNSASIKMCPYEDPNDTDADTNEHELDNEDNVIDVTDCSIPIECVDQELIANLEVEQQAEKTSSNTDLAITQADESETERSKDTNAKSIEEPVVISVQTSFERNDDTEKLVEIHEDKFNDVHEDWQPSGNSFVVNESKKKKGKKNLKPKDKKQKKSKQQQNKSSSAVVPNAENKRNVGFDKNNLESKEIPKEEDCQPSFIRYTLHELERLDSPKIADVPSQKDNRFLENLKLRLQHHQSLVGMAGLYPRKYQDYTNLVPMGNNNNNGNGHTSQNKKNMQLIHINLSLNEEIKLSESKNAWLPKYVTHNSYASDTGKNSIDDTEQLLKKVRGILNKLTAENFNVLLKEMAHISIDTAEKMQGIMLLIFEKTVREPDFAPTYAKFCKVLFDDVKAESKDAFNSLLMNRLEKEFESNVNNTDAKERKLQQIINKLKEATDPQETIELQAELEHQEYQFRRRAWGTVRFIGEMYKLHALSAHRVLLCVESLLQHGNEEKLEYMCKLLSTVGSFLDSSDSKSFESIRMNKIFEKIQTIVKEATSSNKKKPKICSRVRFMMQDLIDLRSKNWGQTFSTQTSQPVTRRRLPEEKNTNLPSSSANTYDRSSSQRMSFGNNNNRQNQVQIKKPFAGSGNFFMQKPSKSQYSSQREQYNSIDLKKLNFSRADDNSEATTTLAPSNPQMWRVVTGRQTSQLINSKQSDQISATPLHQSTHKHHTQQQQQHQQQRNPNSNGSIKAILESCSAKDKELLNTLLRYYSDCLPSRNSRWQEEVSNTWEMTNNDQQICLVYYILMDYLHLYNVKSRERNACANVIMYLMKRNKTFNKMVFNRAFQQFSEDFPDLLTDVPDGWTYVMEFLGPLLHEGLITFNDIWSTNWRNDPKFIEHFVKALVGYFTKEFGAKYTRDLWHKQFKFDQGRIFKSDQQEWDQFVEANKLQFLYDCKAKPDVNTTNINKNSDAVSDQHVQRVEILLSSTNDSNLALDYISTNVNTNSYFLENLTKFLCCDYATTTKTTMPMPASTSRTSSGTTSKSSSTCSNNSSSSRKNANLSMNNNARCAQLNSKAFRNNCLPLLRLCLDGIEELELACLDSVVDAIQVKYDANAAADDVICGIFDILYHDDVIAKESFEKWYKQQELKYSAKSQPKNSPLSSQLNAYMRKLLEQNFL